MLQAFAILLDLAVVFSKKSPGIGYHGIISKFCFIVIRVENEDAAPLTYRFSAPLQDRMFAYVQASISLATKADPDDLNEIRRIIAHFLSVVAVNILDFKYLPTIFGLIFTVSLRTDRLEQMY
jgi:hypothetical protein